MTDTTHEAPERIWLCKDESYWENDLGIVFTFQNGSHDVEYVRADRIEELEAKLAWQPIETAPKDGTEIIVGASLPWHGWRCDMVAWDKNRTMWWDNNGLPYQPTHWMPLPAPPSQN